MNKSILFLIFLGIYQTSHTQNNNSLKQELTNIVIHKQYPHLQHLSTISLLYTGYQNRPIISINSPFANYVNPIRYCTNYRAEMENKTVTVISPDKKYKAFIFSPGTNKRSIYISTLENPRIVKTLYLIAQPLLYIQFLPDGFMCCYKESSLDIAYLHKIPLTEKDNEKIYTFKASSPVIGSMPPQKLTMLSGLNDNNSNPFNVVILDSQFRKQAHIEHHRDRINAIITHASTPFIACASDDGTISLWKPSKPEFNESWEKISCTAILPHTTPVKSICINPEGTYLISGTHNSKEIQFYVWDLKNNTQLFTFPLHNHHLNTMPIYCSWNIQKGQKIKEGQQEDIVTQEHEIQTIALESATFYYETTPKNLFEIIALHKKQASPDMVMLESQTAQLKIDDDSSTILESSDLSPDINNHNSNDNNNNNSNSVSIGLAVSRVPSY